MHNNHDLLCIKFLCLYLANTQNSTYYITVVIWLHLLMQNNHDLLCIKSACLYLANSQNLAHYVIMVIWPHFVCEITTICYASNSCAHTWITRKIQTIISPWLFGFTFWCKITTICYASHSCAHIWIIVKIQSIISMWIFGFIFDAKYPSYASNFFAYTTWLTVKIQPIISPWLFGFTLSIGLMVTQSPSGLHYRMDQRLKSSFQAKIFPHLTLP